MKKLILGIGILFSAFVARSQGLDSVIVEKYYVSNAADAAGSVGTLPVGSVAYRVYVDMAPGYKFQALYGVPGHFLKFTTTTSFFNNEDRGAINPNGITATNTAKNSVMIDSWVSVGGAAAGKMGVLKSEDNDGTIGNTNGILANNDPIADGPITGAGGKDGMIAGTPEGVTTVGITTELNIFDATSLAGNSFIVDNASIASLNGSAGPTSTNRVLVGQFTTDGKFHWELNIQIQRTSDAAVFNYVAQNPVGSELTMPSLMGSLGANTAPSVSVSSPSNGATVVINDPVVIDAAASDADGSVASVQFFVDGTSIGTDATSPYQATWANATPVGTHTLTAKATDNEGAQTTSSAVVINVLNNPPPVVSITSPATGSTAIVPDVVAIAATATDNGSVASVEFFVDGVTSLGIDNTAPFTANWTSTLGSHSLTARATDNLGATATSTVVTITGVNNNPPTVSVTSPSNGASITSNSVTITANAADLDGTVSSVEFFVNSVSIGTDATSPYSAVYTGTFGNKTLTARATDNRGAVTTSASVNITLEDPNALPYRVVSAKNTCLPDSFCLSIMAFKPVANVIGYDMELNYDTTKVKPTGFITKNGSLLNTSYYDVVSGIDSVNGKVNISAYLNIQAPANSFFSGTGNMFCVEFKKKAAFQPVDTAFFSISNLQESYYTGVANKLANDGNYSTYRDSLFHGNLVFWKDNSPVKYNSANINQYLITTIYGTDLSCGNKSAGFVTPDLTGAFTHSILQGQSIQIERDILPTTDVQDVINSQDAFFARRVLTNDVTYVPSVFEMIAMDVNMDGVVSAGDVTQINQRTVLLIPEYKQAWNYDVQGNPTGAGASKDWLFVDQPHLASSSYSISNTYPSSPSNLGVGFSKYRVPVVDFCLPVPVSSYSVCPLIQTEQFPGILLGDVNGSYMTNKPDSIMKVGGVESQVIFDMSKAVINGKNIDIPVSVSSVDDIYALDFSLQFNEDKLAFSSVIDNSGTMQALSNYNTDDKTLRFTASSLDRIAKGQSLVFVRFTMLADNVMVSDLSSMKAYLNGDRVKVATEAPVGLSSNNVSVYPNPANGTLYVESTEHANIQLMDMDGRQVIMETHVNANERQTIDVSTIANGIYMMKIYNNGSVSMKKIVVNR